MSTRVASLLLAGILAGNAFGQDRAAEETFFEVKIRPVLAERCFKCHGGDKVSHRLRVDSRAALIKGGKSGPAIVPGQPDKSLLIQAIRHTPDTDLRMPPNQKLPEAVIADFTAWIKKGALWPKNIAGNPFAAKKHRAFQRLVKPVPPADPNHWSANPVDCFIAACHQEHGLKPVGPADRRVLLRRVYFDLIGLPPAPAEVDAFLADTAPNAFEKVVDRLLASPHYGERWGRHWMDVVRYADTAGDNADYPIPEIYRYRDYIIDAFNGDMPYDQFVQEQLAGDMMAQQGPPEKYASRVVATGFLALSRRYATAPFELWHLTLEDTIDTVGQAFLGLTLRCARCHDHKFDPVTMADYYGLYGIFASTRFPYAGSEEFQSMNRPRENFVPLLPQAKADPLFKAQLKKIQAMESQVRKGDKGKAASLKAELARLRRLGLPADLPGAYAVSEGKSADINIQLRGDPEKKGPMTPRSAVGFLGGALAIPPGQSGRLQLAHWLTRPDNPLTARVMVNRIWQHHFGKGLVATPNNFGLRGEEPTHPELLDYLAAVFIEKGWSVKAIHRLILSSKTYQLASTPTEANMARDPANRWYWHFDRRRLEAEAIRDAILSVSGRLNLARPGPHPFPPIANWHWTQHNPFKEVYPSNHRSVYLMTQRIQKHPFLALFDGPDTNTTTEKRTSSTVPLQALFLMNNPWVKEQAESFARRLLAAAGDDRSRIGMAHELAFGRLPSKEEIRRGLDYLKAFGQELERLKVPPPQRPLEAWRSYARVIFSANEFVYID